MLRFPMDRTTNSGSDVMGDLTLSSGSSLTLVTGIRGKALKLDQDQYGEIQDDG